MTPGTQHATSNSGEIDLRAMAAAYHERPIGTGDEPAFALLSAPVQILAPTVRPSRPPSLVLGVGVGAVLLVASTVAITLTVVTLQRREVVAPIQPAHVAAPSVAAAREVAPPPSSAHVVPAPIAAPAVVPEAAPAAIPAAAPAIARPVIREQAPVDALDTGERAELAASPPTEPETDAEPVPVAEAEGTPVETAPAETAPVEAAADPSPASCDELTCLVEPDAACCKRTAAAPVDAPAPGDANLPAAISRAELETGLAPVLGRLSSCGDNHGFSGTAKVKLQIVADGSVRSATVDSGSPEFRACVAGRAALAKFPATRSGVTVRYPLILR